MTEPTRGELAGFAEKLSAIAAELRDHNAGPAAATTPSGVPLAAVAQALLNQRLQRKNFLPCTLFHEPAWELLLCLYVAHAKGTPLSVKELVSCVDAPVTTSQRWIDQLVHMRLLHREVDPQDRRRLGISLTDAAAQSMAQYLGQVSAG
jgi:DNA-binding MarR family transcriptional regulator